MKKLLDSKFLFIVALSLVVLIVLGVGAFYLFNDNDDTFTKTGYVLNPLSPKVEKYFFDENTGYRENLSQMIEFRDVDDKNVTIFKDSFLHYMDGSMSFLKNGAILDLNSIKGEKAVNFYNITNKSIIEKSGNGYVIKTNGGDIGLNNFIGRISDDKYIVVGSLEAKIPGNDANVKADYFEIVYTEEGVVNIENKDTKYQVTAEGTYIYAGNIVIDLGNKKISSGGKDVMPITAITINGNENIDIIPADEKKDENDGGGGEGNGNNQGGENPNTNDNPGGDNGNGEGGEGGNQQEQKEVLTANLKEASVGSTNIDVSFDIVNAGMDDKFTLKVTNLSSGRTVDMFENVETDQAIKVNLLSPNTKYLFTLINENDGGKYFQKIFETKDFGISLEKNYATDSSLSYKITVGEDTDITNAKLTLYKFNEETNKNEVVKTSYYDVEADEEKFIEKIVNLASIDGNIAGTHEVLFDSLDSNTIYTAVLDEFSFASSNFKDIYNITSTNLTLKKAPSFGDMTADKDINASGFKLALSDIADPDNAITNYTYLIYENSDRTKTAVAPISKTNASAIEVKIGEGENQLKNDTNYFYNVVIEYFDNEKYIEYITSDSINFVMGTEPYITVIPDNSKISFDSIGATIYLIDNSCLITMPGREKCDGDSTAIVDVSRINTFTGERTSVFTQLVDFTVEDNQVKYDLFLDDLQAGTAYTIDVRAVRNDMPEAERVEIMHTDDSKRSITTKSLSSFLAEWTNLESSANHVVNVKSKLVGEEGSGTMTPAETAATIKKVVLKLYEGNYSDDLQTQQPIGTKVFVNSDEFNIKENFYDNGYVITSDETFGLDIDMLRAVNENGKLSEYYTVTINAYYDDESSSVRINNSATVYRISPVLLMENVDEPSINIRKITKSQNEIVTNLLNDGTVVGYEVNAAFDRGGLVTNKLTPQKINFYVYSDDSRMVKFYVMGDNGLILTDKVSVNLGESNSETIKIYMDYGSEYGVVDTNMSRGNKYYIGYELELASEHGTEKYPANSNSAVNSDYGLFADVSSEKETPTLEMYIAKSTANSIIYRYRLVDPDNALYRENSEAAYNFYYVINDGGEVAVPLVRTEDQIKTFSGNITISGLTNGDIYQLYYKKNGVKTGNDETDILNYYDGADDGKHIFDGFYDAKDGTHNFKYSVINNSLYDNKVVIKILADEEIMNRILSYKITFRDGNQHSLVKEYWDLLTCDDDGEKRCFNIDYIDLKNAGMKSDVNTENPIAVTVTAFYDNGLMGYDYTVGENGDYSYMIMQDNNTGTELGTYLTFRSGSSTGMITPWSEGLPKGYYTYTNNGDRIIYRSAFNTAYVASISYNLTSSGYYRDGLGALNPKMVAVANMESDEGGNTFSFSSITPKIAITRTIGLVNGVYLETKLSGADITDFCEEASGSGCVNHSNGEKYLYVDVWANENEVGDNDKKALPTIKAQISNSDPLDPIQIIIEGLSDSSNHAGNYYYRIYAYLNKNNRSVYTQLFDAGSTSEYKTKTYTFTTLGPEKLMRGNEAANLAISYKPNLEGNYNDKLLDVQLALNPYVGNISFNYDISYAFCNYDDVTCGIGEGDSNIFKATIGKNDLATSFVDTQDISAYDLEFDKNYRINIYAIYDLYDKNTGETVKYNLLLNMTKYTFNLAKLPAPEFKVGREATYVDDQYAIDFTVTVDDEKRVLENGKYKIKLLNSNNEVVGILQDIDNGSYVTRGTSDDYFNYEFDATVINKKIRITGLEPNTNYTVVVFGDALLNNATVPVEERTVTIEKTHTVYSTNESGVAFGKPLFSATEKSIVVTFLGGSSFDNVRAVQYTVGLWDGEQSSSTTAGAYILGSTGKTFELYENSDDWRFVINPDWMTNILGKTYRVVLDFYVPKSGEESVVINSEYDIDYDNPDNIIDKFIAYRFQGEVQYVKDKN